MKHGSAGFVPSPFVVDLVAMKSKRRRGARGRPVNTIGMIRRIGLCDDKSNRGTLRKLLQASAFLVTRQT